jgi:hypothetical protein
MLTEKLPVTVGVPLIEQDDIVTPVGHALPGSRVQVLGLVPPLVTTGIAVIAAFCIIVGILIGDTYTIGAAITILKTEHAGELAPVQSVIPTSLTCTLNV